MDIDIDFPTNFNPLDYFKDAVLASMIKDGELVKHPAGAYLQNIPVDSVTGLAAIPYQQAEQQGYTKIDFLHLSILDHFSSKQEIRTLIKTPPDWYLLESAEVVGKLFQLKKHFDVVDAIKPKTIQELADCIALIRPGKRYLLNGYIKNRNLIREELYRPTEDGKYHFKRSHAISYALTIILQLHLISAGII